MIKANKSVIHEDTLQEYNHELAVIVKAIGIASNALDDNDITREEIKNIIKKAHQRLLDFHYRLCPSSMGGRGILKVEI